MKIMIGKIVLADDSVGRRGPQVAAFHGNEDYSLQFAELVRAESIARFQRGNIRTEVTFTTSQQFETNLLAEAFCLNTTLRIPKSGDVTFYAGGSSKFMLPDAAIFVRAFYFVGVTVFTDYHITGGKLERTRAQPNAIL